MRLFSVALVYLSLTLGANADVAALEALREGEMRKLNFHSAPMPSSDIAFKGEDGSEMTLADFNGKFIVLNFWATWCAPCRKEMPMLSELQDIFDADTLEIVTIATGRNPRPGMERFFADIGVDNLPLHTDERQNLARSLGVLGLPVTIILNPDGQEIARMQGDADWNSESAIAILNALTTVTAD